MWCGCSFWCQNKADCTGNITKHLNSRCRFIQISILWTFSSSWLTDPHSLFTSLITMQSVYAIGMTKCLFFCNWGILVYLWESLFQLCWFLMMSLQESFTLGALCHSKTNWESSELSNIPPELHNLKMNLKMSLTYQSINSGPWSPGKCIL